MELYKITTDLQRDNLPSLQDEIFQQLLKCKEDLLKMVYENATGDALTVENAHEVQLATFGSCPDELLAIRGNTVGMIEQTQSFTPEGGYKMGFTFNPDRKRF